MTKFGVVFLLLVAMTTAVGIARPLHPEREAPTAPGVAANQRLTALAGALLVILTAAIAVTILFIQPLLPEHYVVGFVFIPPLALKLASTAYRFARYYAGQPAYRLAGPPPALLRFVIAPVLVLSVLAVFATGLELWLFGLRFGTAWMIAHTLSAAVFVPVAGLHLVARARPSTAAALAEFRASRHREAISGRALVIGSLLLGASLAAASLLYATPFPPAAAGG